LLEAGGGAPSGSGAAGGSGSTFVADATNPFGVLATSWSDAETVLAALGSGTAAEGTEPGRLVTDRPSIPGFVSGHWVEVHAPTGELRGRWRISGVDGNAVHLDGGASAVVQEGDSWAGLYRLDGYRPENSVVMADRLRLERSGELMGAVAVDGLEVAGDLVVRGSLSAGSLWAQNVVVASEGRIEARPAAGSLRIEAPGQV
jgi:hypothetical protein